ncbi:NADH dehydrogenase subunit 1 (mitochondrion) [Physella acuta]|uniref:NADH-ubiquinone oxidoreductase chain 1 n=1 Tax=Physella acuta TaxID=109671 RepID=V9IPM0_PHYAT|nr:NADH dehydrogenase subunit 1 [Physella acuta]AFE62764.1 NADH dehydrogenase subunit 1 [Physella acuta]
MTLLILSNLLTCLCILLGVAFYTLLERKVLSYIQIRKGPKMIGVMGLLQPISDAVKLFTKEMLLPHKTNYMMYWVSPMVAFSLAMMFWIMYPMTNGTSTLNLSMVIFLVLSSLNVFGIMMSGWASNSKYAFLGAMRAMAQTISYEVSFVFIVLFVTFLSSSLSIEEVNTGFGYLLLFFPLLMIFISSIMAETNRAPFDFAEGESELVSGFNVEYGGGGFVLLFLAEYSNILFMSVLASSMCFGVSQMSMISTSAQFTMMSLLFLLARGAYPRLRYDLLMSLCWKCYLPVSMCIIIMIGPMI